MALTLVDITALEFDLLGNMLVFIFALKVGLKLLVLTDRVKACILLSLDISKSSNLCSLTSIYAIFVQVVLDFWEDTII